jgi:hypothetical protein
LAFKIHEIISDYPHDLVEPPWIADRNFMRSHRSYLIRRKPEYYGNIWPNTPENMPIIWPQIIKDGTYRLRIAQRDIALLRSGERELPGWLRYDRHRNEIIDLEEEDE